MNINDFLGSSEGHVIQTVSHKSDTSVTYENFYEPPYNFIMNGCILLVCLIFFLKGMFSLITATR